MVLPALTWAGAVGLLLFLAGAEAPETAGEYDIAMALSAGLLSAVMMVIIPIDDEARWPKRAWLALLVLWGLLSSIGTLVLLCLGVLMRGAGC